MSLMTENLLQSAEALRLQGDAPRAITVLSEVLTQTTADITALTTKIDSFAASKTDAEYDAEYTVLSSLDTTTQMRGIATYQLILLLLQSPTAPNVTRAHTLLTKLGFSLSLSPKILSYDTRHFTKPRPPAPANPTIPTVKVFDNALTTETLKTLTEIFDPTKTFFTVHNYPTPMFFSYNLPLDSQPTFLHSLTHQIHALLLPSFPQLKNATSSEIWAHSRHGDGHHQFHYDLDEVTLATSGQLKSPLVSCVVYLTTVTGDEYAGNPTVVVDRCVQDIDEGDEEGEEGEEQGGSEKGRAGVLVYPKVNRLMAFPGGNLHCVVPGLVQDSTGSDSPDPDARRTTLMIGFWDTVSTTAAPSFEGEEEEEEELEEEEKEGLELGPNMSGIENTPWFGELGGSTGCAVLNEHIVAGTVEYVDDVWDEVEGAAEEEFGEWESDVAFTGRFFLRESIEEIDHEVLSGVKGYEEEEEEEEDEEEEEEGGGTKRKAEIELVDIADLVKKSK